MPIFCGLVNQIYYYLRLQESFRQPNAKRNTDETNENAEKNISKSRQKLVFSNQFPSFQLKSRKRRVCAEKTDDDCKAQIFARLKLVGKKHQQKTNQKRTCNIDKKCRKRKRFENVLQRRKIYQISRYRAERTADCHR